LRRYSASNFKRSAIFASSSCFFLSLSASSSYFFFSASASFYSLSSSSAFFLAFSIFFFWFSDSSSTGTSGSSYFTALNFLVPFGFGPFKLSSLLISLAVIGRLTGSSSTFFSSTYVTF
jgi:hypothetical protein